MFVNVKPMAETRKEVCVHLRGGKKREMINDRGIPERDLEKKGESLAKKFKRMAQLSAARIRAVQECVASLDQLGDVRELLALL